MFESQNDLKLYLKAISGIAFFATPHITKCNETTAEQLAGILRDQSASSFFVMKDDLKSLALSALQFAGLKLHCPIMSCYEQKSIKIEYGFARWSSRALVRYWSYLPSLLSQHANLGV